MVVDRVIAILIVVFGVMIAIAWDAAIVSTFITQENSKSTILLFIYAI